MAWDFETDPEFQKKLDWIEEFMADEVEPLSHLGMAVYGTAGPREVHQAAAGEGAGTRACGPATWAPNWAARAIGQLKLGLMNEKLGRNGLAPTVFGCQAPDTGNAEIIAHYGTDAEQKEK